MAALNKSSCMRTEQKSLTMSMHKKFGLAMAASLLAPSFFLVTPRFFSWVALSVVPSWSRWKQSQPDFFFFFLQQQQRPQQQQQQTTNRQAIFCPCLPTPNDKVDGYVSDTYLINAWCSACLRCMMTQWRGVAECRLSVDCCSILWRSWLLKNFRFDRWTRTTDILLLEQQFFDIQLRRNI